MLYKDYLISLKALVIARWTSLERVREREAGATYNPAERDAVIRDLTSAASAGEVGRILDSHRWGTIGIMHLLVEAAVPTLPQNEFAPMLNRGT